MPKLTPLLNTNEMIFWDAKLLKIGEVVSSLSNITYKLYYDRKHYKTVPEYAILWKFAGVKEKGKKKRGPGRPSHKMRIKDLKGH